MADGATAPSSGLAALAGAVAAGVALAAGELVGAMADPPRSLVGSVAGEVVDRAGAGPTRWAIDVFGTADKAALVVAVVAVCLALGAALGVVAARHPWAGPAAFAGVAAVGLVADARTPPTSGGAVAVAVVAAVAAAAAGALTLRALLARRPAPRPAAPSGPAGDPGRAAAVERPTVGAGPRRSFFAWAGAASAFAAVAAVGARTLAGRSTAEVARAGIRLPAPAEPPGPAPAGLAVDGLTPQVVPNADFYRIDTALFVPQVDPATWRLAVAGMVDRPFELTFDELAALPLVEEQVTLACVSNPVGGDLVGNATWLGVPLARLLDEAGVRPGATQVVGRSVDGFTAGFPTEAAYDGRSALVAIGMNGEPLPVLHGFPARLVVAGLYGYVSATKWLQELRLARWEDVDGYWIPRGWAKEGPVKTQSRIDVPRPGGQIDPGPTTVAGVAWAPTRGIARVEVQVGDGPWREAELGRVPSDETWCQWRLAWDATPGRHTLRVRATDGTGETQTAEEAPPDPDGATGWDALTVTVRG